MTDKFPESGSWEWRLGEYETRKRVLFDKMMRAAIHIAKSMGEDKVDTLKEINGLEKSYIMKLTAIDTLLQTGFTSVWHSTLSGIETHPHYY